MNILYISYDGITEPLGQSQVLNYLERLSGPNRRFFLISYEKTDTGDDSEVYREVKYRTEKAGISWFPLQYRKNPPVISSILDILSGYRLGKILIKQKRIDIVHARSYVAGVAAALLKKTTGAKLLFDMRALYIDQRVDGGLWKINGAVFRVGKAAERWMLRKSDGIVVLTEAMKKYLLVNMPDNIPEDATISVIPTCADTEVFDPSKFNNSGENIYAIIYSGSLVNWYEVPSMAIFFKAVLDSDPLKRILVLTRSEPDELLAECKKLNIDTSRIDITSSPYSKMPEKIATGAAGFLILKDCLSRLGVYSTKTAEFLSMGKPIVINAGHEDKDRLLTATRTGVILDSLDYAGCRKAVDKLDLLLEEHGLPARCRETADEHLSLRKGVDSYETVYREIETIIRKGKKRQGSY